MDTCANYANDMESRQRRQSCITLSTPTSIQNSSTLWTTCSAFVPLATTSCMARRAERSMGKDIKPPYPRTLKFQYPLLAGLGLYIYGSFLGKGGKWVKNRWRIDRRDFDCFAQNREKNSKKTDKNDKKTVRFR